MKRATLMSLADYILHTAGEDADRGGFGVRDLNLHNASWVLTRMALAWSACLSSTNVSGLRRG